MNVNLACLCAKFLQASAILMSTLLGLYCIIMKIFLCLQSLHIIFFSMAIRYLEVYYKVGKNGVRNKLNFLSFSAVPDTGLFICLSNPFKDLLGGAF